MGYDFFREADERPEAVKEADTAFRDTDIMQEGPDLISGAAEQEQKSDGIEEKSELEEKIEAKEQEVEEAIQEGESQEAVEEAIKELAAMYGEKEYKVPAEAKFKHKVDGEEVEVGLQDLLNNYSGKQSWDKKFSELDSERTAYKSDLEVVNKYVSEFAEISKKDKVEGLIRLAESVGIDPLEYKRQLRSELLSKYGEYLQMDESDRSHYEQREELEYLRQKQETELRRRSEEQAQRELQSRYSEIQQTHGIDNDRLNYLASELRDVYKADVNPENVLQLHESIGRLDRVDATLTRINPNLAEDDNKVLQLESLLRGNPQMTDQQLYETASKLWGSDVEKAVANLEKKVVKKADAKNENRPLTYQSKLNKTGNSLDFFD